MRKIFAVLLIPVIIALSCKKKEVDPEPGYILQKWSRATERLDYREYSACEAYPKSEAVFREMYRDDYFAGLMVIEAGDPGKEEGGEEKDYKGDSYIRRTIVFEGSAVKRAKKEPYQIIRGDIVFVKFISGERRGDGWLLSNRTITRIEK